MSHHANAPLAHDSNIIIIIIIIIIIYR